MIFRIPLLHSNYSTSDKSKTIFKAMYGFVRNVDSLPPIGCFACRLEETEDKSDKKLGINYGGNLCGRCHCNEFL